VSENQAEYPIATMCRLLGVSPSGYYAWTQRQPSRRAQTDAALVAEIRAAHEASRGIYGAPRNHVDLAAKGIRVGRKRVVRLMSAAGLAGVSRGKFVTTTVKSSDRQAPDLVDRNFTAERPNLLRVADITYIATWADPRHPAGARRLEHGARGAATEGRDPPLRPGLAAHLH
jgi:putative transposase